MKVTLEQIEEQQRQLNELIEAFKKQGEPKQKAYTWEECFQQKGFWCMKNSELTFDIDLDAVESNASIATTEKVIKSHLAACQLSHIIEAINKDFEDNGQCGYAVYFQGCLSMSNTIDWCLPRLNSPEAFEKLIETNAPLLLQYFGVPTNIF